MGNISEKIESILKEEVCRKIIISKPSKKTSEFRKVDIQNKTKNFQIAKYTQKQVFHENVEMEHLAVRVEEITLEEEFRQLNLWTESFEYIFLLSKKGELSVKSRSLAHDEKVSADSSHNREKNYIISEGQQVAPLVDMGVFTREGKVVRSMYDKFK